jgi:hypothetical protein
VKILMWAGESEQDASRLRLRDAWTSVGG